MSSILRLLDAEWERLARCQTARVAVRRWRGEWPALGDAEDLAELLDSGRSQQERAERLRVLAALAPIDELAARALLQALMPGLVRLGNEHRARGGIDEVIGLAWERIRTYPTTRSGSVAGNVILDVRKTLRRSPGPEAPSDTGPMLVRSKHSVEGQALAHVLVETLEDAARSDRMVTRDLPAVIRTRLLGEPIAAVAAEAGVSTNVMCQRRWRMEARLRALMGDWAGDQRIRCSAA